MDILREFASVWNWFFSFVAGWGITTTVLVSAVVFLWLRVRLLERKYDSLYNRIVTDEREWSLFENRDKV